MGSLMHVAAGPCTMSSLSRHLTVSLPTTSKSVDMLVRRGWLERWNDKQDRRQTMVRLTPRGRRVLADIRARTEQHVRRSLEPLTAVERVQVVNATRALSRVLTPPGGGDD
jgi:DNA-binding MarR family transcriptional regulator